MVNVRDFGAAGDGITLDTCAIQAALDAGADDVASDDDIHEIICKPEDLGAVRDTLEQKFGTPNAARMDWRPTVQTPVSDLETAQKLMNFIDLLNEDDDVQRVITNADIAEDILAKLEAE